MPAGRGKKPAKSVGPRAPVEDALCPELDDLDGDGGAEDSPGSSSHAVSGGIPSRKRPRDNGPGLG